MIAETREMTGRQRALWDYLQVHCVGKGNMVRASVIAEALGLSWREVMRAKKGLVEEHGKKIAASKRSPWGIYVCVSDEEWLEYAGVTRRTIRSHAQLDRAMERTVRTELVVAEPPPREIIRERRTGQEVLW